MRPSVSSAVSIQPLHSRRSATEELIARVARGEPSAVGELYDLHHQAVRGMARRLLGDPESAEDLVHDVFVALPKVIQNYSGQSTLRTFLLGIAVNHARHHVRAAIRRRRAMDRLALEPHRSIADPERDLARRQLADALTCALDTLPVDQRVAFVLCDVEERTSAEAATLVGAPEGTIRTRLFHARRKLREQLADHRASRRAQQEGGA